MTAAVFWRALGRSCGGLMLMLILFSGCDDETPIVQKEPGVCAPNAEQSASPEPLRWRRHQLLLRDLSQALELPTEALCDELGTLPCEQIHLISLGGNNPFEVGLYEPIASPIPLTPIAVERLVLNACIRRVESDQASSSPVVFSEIDLKRELLDAQDQAAVRLQVIELFKRIHHRAPLDEEVEIVATLAQGSSAASFAVLSCYTIATTTELAFF